LIDDNPFEKVVKKSLEMGLGRAFDQKGLFG